MPASSRLLTHWPLAAALVFLCVFQLTLDRATRRAADGHLVYPLDDTYIQMALAKHLAADGVWGVTRYEFSGAGSSLAWPLLIASVDRIAGVHDRAPFALNALSAILLLTLSSAVLRRHLTSRPAQAVTLGLVVIATPLAVLVSTGMEHTLECAIALALAAAGVRLCVATNARERRTMLALTLIAAALTVATRFDAASVLVALLALILITRGWRLAALVGLSGAAPAVVYALIARGHGWPLVPTSVLLKHRLAGVDPLSWHGAASYLAGGLTALVNAPFLLVLVLLALALIISSGHDSGRELERRFLLLIFVGATLVHVQFGRLGWLHRYEAYLVAIGIVVIASALGPRLSTWRPLGAVQRAAALAVCVVVLFPLLLRGEVAVRDLLEATRSVYLHEYQLGQFFRRYPPAGAVMISDIGTTAYFADVPIVDPAGLATYELLSHPRGIVENADDAERLSRAAEERGVRVSVSFNPSSARVVWQCVAGWKAGVDAGSDARNLFAVDVPTALKLRRDLQAFADDSEGVVEVSLGRSHAWSCRDER